MSRLASQPHSPARLGWLVCLLCLLATPARAEDERHRVIAGDSLWKIARANGCTVDALREANDMKPGDPLPVGRMLEIPRCKGRVAGGPSRYVVKSGDTLSSIALRHSTTVKQIKEDNGLSDSLIRPGQSLVVGPGVPEVPLRLVPGQSVGRPQRGKLVSGALLPPDSAYYRRHPDRVWGAQHVIDHVRRAVASVRRRYPGLHRLAIGDISSKRGGFISGHRSHQSGRDVDLGLYFERVPSGYPDEFVTADKGRLHLGATWALLSTLWDASREPGGPARVFLDYGVQGELYDYARSQGVSKRELRQIFQYPNGRGARGRFVSHEPKHADHLHVRFQCAPKDTDCR